VIRLVPAAAPAASQLRALLTDPEMAALAGAPPMRRLLRPLCQMLGVEPPPPVPKRQAALHAAAPPPPAGHPAARPPQAAPPSALPPIPRGRQPGPVAQPVIA
jgi:hypothetical protein